MNYITQQFQAGQVLRASQLNAMEAAIKTSMKAARPVQVILGKTYESGSNATLAGLGTHITIRALDFEPNKEYAIQLFRWSSNNKAWVSLYSDDTQQEIFGWHTLKGKVRFGTKNNPSSYFPNETPTWMTNNGRLKSRWYFNTNTTTHKIEFRVSDWVVDMLKPLGTNWSSNVGLIGVPKKHYKSVKFKAGVLQKTSTGTFELVGMSDQVLNVYINTTGIAVSHCSIHDKGLVDTKISY